MTPRSFGLVIFRRSRLCDFRGDLERGLQELVIGRTMVGDVVQPTVPFRWDAGQVVVLPIGVFHPSMATWRAATSVRQPCARSLRNVRAVDTSCETGTMRTCLHWRCDSFVRFVVLVAQRVLSHEFPDGSAPQHGVPASFLRQLRPRTSFATHERLATSYDASVRSCSRSASASALRRRSIRVARTRSSHPRVP